LVYVKLAEDVIGAGTKVIPQVAPAQDCAGLDIDADSGSDHCEVMEVEALILDHELAVTGDRWVVDGMDVVKVVVDRHDHVRAMGGLGIQYDPVGGGDGAVGGSGGAATEHREGHH
jgi:hypothetical protein